MNWIIVNDDILNRSADVLILSGNVQLNLSGGVGGAFLQRFGDDMQLKLHQYLERSNRKFVERGDVFPMPSCGSPYLTVLHAIGVDAFYDSNVGVIRDLISKSLELASQRSAKTVALTAIATGYGRMSIADFAAAVNMVANSDFPPIERVEICVVKNSSAKSLLALIPSAIEG